LASKGHERDTPYKGSKPADVQELQEKLQRLRKEQQEADAARDKAWKQLKVCSTAGMARCSYVCKGVYSWHLISRACVISSMMLSAGVAHPVD
jgi:hypothetical protein